METLKEMLTRHEGRKNKPYYCSNHKKTIGIGHNIDANGLPKDIQDYLGKNKKITDEMIDRLFDGDVSIAKRDCLLLYPNFNNFSEARQNALIDFLFNVGHTTAKTFKNTNKLINEGKWKEAAENMEKSLWYKQVKSRGEDIVNMIEEG